MMQGKNNEDALTELTALRQRVAELEQAEQMLLHRNAELDALYTTTLALMNRLEVGAVLQAIIQRAGQLVAASHGCIATIEMVEHPPGVTEQAVAFQAVMGIYEQFAGYDMHLGEGLMGKVWQAGKPLVIDDYDTWPGRSERFTHVGFKALVGIPLIAGTRIIGILSLASIQPGSTFDAHAVELLERFACLAALALENARLYDVMERELTERKRAEAINQAHVDRLRELSTPLMPISDDVVAMPLVGAIDTWRAQQIMEELLQGIAHHHAQIAIVDITGVAVVDQHVAHALVRTAQAAQLLGAQVVLTGIRPDVAQTLVTLGVDLGSLVTRPNLQSGIAYALGTHHRAW
jgi:anti-anti-sigma regulatory factor